MERQRITSAEPTRRIFGYCRAVRVGDNVYVAGTAPQMPDGADPPADSYGQAQRCFEIIGAALAEAGSSFEDVVRTRMYITPEADFDEVGRAHGEIFETSGPSTRPWSSRGSSIRDGTWRSTSMQSST